MDRCASHVAPRLLVADEDQTACTFLQDNLTADGYHVDAATTSNAAFAYLRAAAPELILADVNGNTLALVDHVRAGAQGLCAAAPDTPIIALTSHRDELHRVRLLERGSDDVIAKPFSYPELRARVEAVLRRTAPRQPGAIVTAGPVRIDRRRRTVTVGDRPVEVRGLEYALLCALAAEPTRVLTKVNFERFSFGLGRIGDPLARGGSGRLTTALCPEGWSDRARTVRRNPANRMMDNVHHVGQLAVAAMMRSRECGSARCLPRSFP